MRRPACGVAFWHVFARGSRRLGLYFEEQDFREFLMFLREALIVSGCSLYGYCLMDNHYHLILRGDQSQLTDLRFQGRGALNPGHPVGQANHLAHPGAGFRCREVGAHTRAEVTRGADIEHSGPVVGEQVDAWCVGEGLGQMALLALGGADP